MSGSMPILLCVSHSPGGLGGAPEEAGALVGGAVGDEGEHHRQVRVHPWPGGTPRSGGGGGVGVRISPPPSLVPPQSTSGW